MTDTMEIFGEVRRETPSAILFFDGTTEAWIPLSLILQTTKHRDGVEIEIPEWLAKERGFV